MFYSGNSKENFRVTVGNHDNSIIDEFESQPAIEEIILHEHYSSKLKFSVIFMFYLNKSFVKGKYSDRYRIWQALDHSRDCGLGVPRPPYRPATEMLLYQSVFSFMGLVT